MGTGTGTGTGDMVMKRRVWRVLCYAIPTTYYLLFTDIGGSGTSSTTEKPLQVFPSIQSYMWLDKRERAGRGRENSSRCIWCDLTPRSSHTEYMEVLCRTRVGISKSYTTNTCDKQSITRECALSLTQLPIHTHDYPSSLLIIM